MKKILLLIVCSLTFFTAKTEMTDSTKNTMQNTSEKMLSANSGFTIGGYGQFDYNQAFSSDVINNGTLDIHRLVMLFGYRFNERTQFITEIEYEHVTEVYIEQAFLQYKINDFINFRGGLMLIPMGIINEYHEPVTFNGVERPSVDKYIAPTTWREVGFGLNGNIIDASIKYQVYLVNGFNSYDGSAKLSGANGLRKGRQKGAESFINSPNYTGKITYYGINSITIGLSGYFGKTQSTLYDGIDKTDETLRANADSSVVGVSMLGLDAKYNSSGIQIKGQFYIVSLSNTEAYNRFTASKGTLNDLGNSMVGYYLEAGYNVFKSFNAINTELIPFVRYEAYDTHNSVENNIVRNDLYNKNIITTGIGWKVANGAMLKADLQFIKSKADNEYSKVFNAGIGIMF